MPGPAKSFKIVPGSVSGDGITSDVDVSWHFHSEIGKVEPMVMLQ